MNFYAETVKLIRSEKTVLGNDRIKAAGKKQILKDKRTPNPDFYFYKKKIIFNEEGLFHRFKSHRPLLVHHASSQRLRLGVDR